MSAFIRLYGMDGHVHEGHFSLHRICRLTAPGLVYASVMGLTGCATSAELESLRAEVAKANATAVRAEAEVAKANAAVGRAEAEVYKTQRELAALKAAARLPEAYSSSREGPSAPVTNPSGYKWGKRPEY